MPPGSRAADTDPMDIDNRPAWESASQKHVREYDDLLRQAAEHTSLLERERELLRPILRTSPSVVHLQSGHGLDDLDMVAEGAWRVIGVDFSATATGAAQRRADELGAPCRYITAELPGAPLADPRPTWSTPARAR